MGLFPRIGASTQRVFALAALGIGGLVAAAYRRGAGRVDGMGRVIAATLTLVSIIVGEVAMYACWVAQRRPDLGFNLDAGWFVYLKMWAQNPGQEVFVVVFALTGAWFSTRSLQRPKLHPVVRTADDVAREESRKAA